MKGLIVTAIFIGACFASARDASAQWHRLADPPGAMALAFADVKGASGRCYIATINGVWLTNDHMQSWKPAGLQSRVIYSISTLVGPSQREYVFASLDSGIFRSMDSGLTWTRVYSRYAQLFVDSGFVYAFPSDTIYSIYRSVNFGDAWSRIGAVPYGLGRIAISHGVILSALPQSGLWRWNTDSVGWEKIDVPGSNNFESIAAAGDTIYIGSDKAIGVSTDLGLTWTIPANAGLDTTNLSIGFIAGHGDTIVIDAWNGIYRSQDGAATWTRVDGSGGYPNYHGRWPGGGYDVSVAWVDGHFVAGEPGGIFHSSDGVSWSFAGHGLKCASTSGIIADGNDLFVNVNGAVFHSVYGGAKWNEQADLENATRFQMVNGMLFVITGDGRIWRRTNGKWIDFPSSVMLNLTAVHDTLYGTRWAALYCSLDSGATWKQTLTDHSVKWVQYVFSFGDTLCALPNIGQAGWPVYSTTDGCQTWTETGYFPTDGGYFYMLGAQTSTEALICSANRINHTQDGGHIWKTIAMRLPTFITTWKDRFILGLTDTAPEWSGLFRLSGSRLVQILPDTAVSTIMGFTADSQFAYIATANKGVWATTAMDIPLSVERAPTLESRELEISPNPSTGFAKFEYALPNRSYISLKLYDTRGTLRATVFEGEHEAGDISIPFRDAELPNGVYEAVLTTPSGTQAAKLVIDR